MFKSLNFAIIIAKCVRTQCGPSQNSNIISFSFASSTMLYNFNFHTSTVTFSTNFPFSHKFKLSNPTNQSGEGTNFDMREICKKN